MVINVCAHGRHQSVGNASGQKAVVQDQLYGVHAKQKPETTVQLLYLQADSHWESLCNNCSLCDTNTRKNRQNMERAYGMLKHFIKSPFNIQLTATNWSPLQANPQRPPGMPPMMPASSSGSATAKATEGTSKTSRIPPAASTRTCSRSATNGSGQSVTAAPPKTSQPVPAIRGTAQTASHSATKAGTGKKIPIPGTKERTTGPRADGRIFYKKRSGKDTGASKADSRQEERIEEERSRGAKATRRDKAESLHQADTSEPAAIEIEERETKDLVNHYGDDVTVTVINKICKFYHREEKVFELIQRYEQPTSCLLYLLQKHREITYGNVVKLFQEFADDSRATP